MPLTSSARFARSVLVGAVLLLSAAGLVRAEEPQPLREPVTDLAGVMSDAQRDEAESAIAAVADEVTLRAMFVRTTDGIPAPDYATQVATLSGLGGNDAVLVVALDDRQYAVWVGPLLDDVSDEEIDTFMVERVEPELRDEDWGQVVAAAAQGVVDALVTDGDAGPPPDTGETPGGSDAGGDGAGLWVILGIVALVIGGLVLWNWWRRRRGEGMEAEERDRRIGGLVRKANAMLIETDELIRHDSQELGFAEAQFGKAEAKAFKEALDKAREELGAAFAVRQRLDDGTPESPEEREALLNEIVARCTTAQQTLTAQTERFQQLRDLERRAPELLAALPEEIGAAEARIPEAEAAMEELRSRAPGAATALAGNAAEARKRISLARAGVDAGSKAVAGSDASGAGRAVKAAQDALAQATALLDAVARESAVLREAERGLDDALKQAKADVGAAAAALRAAQEPPEGAAGELAEAQRTLEAAEAAAVGRGADRDLITAFRLAKEAEAAADALLATVEEGEAKRARAIAAVDAELSAAAISVDRAEDYIGARRHTIGREARTRLSEARTSLERARHLRDSDPGGATEAARRARTLADQAYDSASRQFRRSPGGAVVIGGRRYDTGRDSDWGSDIGGAIIGGIIGSILSGGGRGGGWGGGFGGGGFGRSGGGFGGFGGGGGGRSFGGGFGGGGGRSRGGGW